MLEKLQHIDTELFLFLNGLHSGFFDTLMYWISHPAVWVPLYLFFVYLIYKYYPKNYWIYLIFLGLSVGAADWTSVHWFKEVFMRPRPCHNPDIQSIVHIVRDHCGGQYGFVSSHAANTFAIAGFMFWTLRKRIPYIFWWLMLWAALVGYSRIYLGVHYPGDVLAGAALGFTLSSFYYGLMVLVSPRNS